MLKFGARVKMARTYLVRVFEARSEELVPLGNHKLFRTGRLNSLVLDKYLNVIVIITVLSCNSYDHFIPEQPCR